MKTGIKLLFVLLITIQAKAQEIPSIKVGDDKLGITSLDIQVEVVGNVATTTYDMLFYNPTNVVLEGELSFPLGEGQNVSRLALEVNGKLREAVVVEKEIGRVAFEAVVRRRVDPILLEKGTGNNYKARIYPIPARGYKRVILAHEQELIISDDSHYFQLPLGFKKNLDHFALELQILDQEITPEVTIGGLDNFGFNRKNGNYFAKFEKKNFTPKESLTIKIPQDYHTTKIITSNAYFYVYKNIKNTKRLREKAERITMYWDASLSMQDREIEKELTFLEGYFAHLKTVEIKLVKFSNTITLSKNYSIKNGNWDILKKELRNTTYDGGTAYAPLFLKENSDEILMFSDGMNNLSDMFLHTEQPVFVINSIVKANHSALHRICEATNGKYLNLKNRSVNHALQDIKEQPFKFLGYETSNKTLEIYPKKGITVNSDFSIAGKNFKNNDKIILLFGYGNTITYREPITLNSTNNNSLVRRIWAQKKLREQQQESDKNKEEIIKHSKQYNLVSNHTSLIVLERVSDYVRYQITPPEELLEAYNRIINRKVVAANANTTTVENGVVTEEMAANNTNSSGNITGTITDENGVPLPTATVIIEGTTTGTSTDFDGNFFINASPGDVLIVSYVGYGSGSVTVGNANFIRCSLKPDNSLDEVVVTALGMKRESRETVYQVEKVSSESISSVNTNALSQSLAGKVAGLQVKRESNTVNPSSEIILRGSNSISRGNKVLVIVDGFVASSDQLDDLNPNDVTGVQVLKGARAATLYGSRASSGVLIITTKFSRRLSGGFLSKKKKRKVYKGSLVVQKNENNAVYIKELEKAKSLQEAYAIYLNQRSNYGNVPAYYIDVHDYFTKWNKEEISLRILTNIAEMDFDNYELLRVFAYKLETLNNYALASYVYNQILKLRPEDSQSYRDLALAYKESGFTQESFNLLNGILNNSIYENKDRRKFAGMQHIVKNEINQLIQNNVEINKEKLEKIQEIQTSFDVRIVIDWNHNDTDIDLHVIDPFQEECFYSHPKTRIGGEISQDMTQGFGPEEFTLRNAKKGAYFVKVNYFGDRYQKVENPTFMKVTMFRNFGTPEETKEIQIIRLTKSKDKQIVARLDV